MAQTIAILMPGAMGSAIGARLATRGARVVAPLAGRSVRTIERARAAGIEPVDLSEAAQAGLVLSIVPPAEAAGLAERMAPHLRAAGARAVFIDCNAVSPETMRRIAARLEGSVAAVLDGAIIGLPPAPGRTDPRLSVSGDPDDRSAVLGRFGLAVSRIDGPVGAASALKMAYAGINKGLIALGASVLLAADRAGCAAGLRTELATSLPAVDARLVAAIPDMFPKAHRWIAEMREIAAFVGPNDPAAGLFEATAGIFECLALDRESEGALAARLERLLGTSATG